MDRDAPPFIIGFVTCLFLVMVAAFISGLKTETRNENQGHVLVVSKEPFDNGYCYMLVVDGKSYLCIQTAYGVALTEVRE